MALTKETKSGLVIYKIGKTHWEIIHYVGLEKFVVYKNSRVARGLYLPNDFDTEGGAMMAILKTLKICISRVVPKVLDQK